MAYDSPGTLGPTADYAGDPGDYSGGSSFNPDSLFAALGQIGSSAFQFGSAYVTGQNQPSNQPFYNNPQQPQQQQPMQGSNSAMYIGIAVVALIIIIALVFLLKK